MAYKHHEATLKPDVLKGVPGSVPGADSQHEYKWPKSDLCVEGEAGRVLSDRPEGVCEMGQVYLLHSHLHSNAGSSL